RYLSLYSHLNKLTNFFYYLDDFVHRRNLPSFPTRRSSDLPGGLARGHFSGDRTRQAKLSAFPEVRRVPLSTYFRRRAAEVEERKDRKSTRLNSSHQIISYAVFCLKKKIIRSSKNFKSSTRM